ncbi:MAG: YggS family pyridoxal phosphate-dependent enzyme [Pirellulales bacterium]
MNDPAGRIAENLAQIRARIEAAAKRASRAADAVTLVAVTKYASVEMAAAVVREGCHDLGESRPQELWAKAAALSDPAIRWHMVGHLQRNKVRRTVELVHLIQSVDSFRLLAAIDAQAAQLGRKMDALIEVNISGDAAKTGLAPDDLQPLLAQAATLSHVSIRGLMGMATLEGDQVAARRDFAALRTLRDRLASRVAPPVSLSELSMGMSGDFEAAIEEGATIVRLGSALFEGLDA